jgi:hypothetical protein
LRALGIVTQASGAHLHAASASAGSTVYDSDELSTEGGGALQFRGSAVYVVLFHASGVTLRSLANGTQAQLRNGTVTISVARASAMEILADNAAIRPLADVPTVAQITIIGPKELQIYAQRGALQFSYHGESAALQEGSSYRILLDPPNTSTPPQSQGGPRPQGHKNLPFKIIIGAGAALATAIVVHKFLESPDRP